MDLELLVERARSGDVKAFVKLTGRFQHAACGSALALLYDFQLAEDVVPEAFVTAWSGLCLGRPQMAQTQPDNEGQNCRYDKARGHPGRSPYPQ